MTTAETLEMVGRIIDIALYGSLALFLWNTNKRLAALESLAEDEPEGAE